MQVKFGYGLKDKLATAVSQGKLDAGDIVIVSDSKQMAFIESDLSVTYLKEKGEIFKSLNEAEGYLTSPAAYVGETVKALLEDGKYHIYILQPFENGYVLEEVGKEPNVIEENDINNLFN